MAIQPRNRPHFHLEGVGETEDYVSPRTGRSGLPPARVRAAHANALHQSILSAVVQAQQRIQARDPDIAEGLPGFYLEFDIPAAQSDALDGLENRPKAIELVAVKPSTANDQVINATVYVPEKAADFFKTKIEQYRDQNTKKGNPKNQNLIARIDDVRLGVVRSLFTDAASLFPQGIAQAWWEVWLRSGKLGSFTSIAKRLDITVRDSRVSFPERDVVLVLSDVATMARLIENSDAVAELRAAKDTPNFFFEMKPVEQAEWAGDLANRAVTPGEDAPAVCILDSGATRGHVLIAPGLAANDQHAYDDAWGVGDSANWNGHGTRMAGVALYSDLHTALAHGAPVQLTHRLETVKILPPAGQNDPLLYGAITETGILKAENNAPNRRRAICMSVTSDIGLARGRPSSWSSAIDKLCYNNGANQRLLVLSAGNIREDIIAADYPDRNDLAECENPTQSWNALVVGAYTEKITITDPTLAGWLPVAPAGDLSPASRTSTVWERQWPIRPDVVFEGGNYAHDAVNPASAIDDLQLVTTHYRPNIRAFDTFGDTSAAAALAANFSARVLADHPLFWPETVRALMVHSAEWTPAMRGRFNAAINQTQKTALLRRYGWGVPNIDRALRSAANDATLVIEDSLLPFRNKKGAIKTRDMHVHRLPWPREQLLALGGENVELRVTLSYFVEPNPGERGWTRRHRYSSHSLRFALKRSLETLGQFRQRMNKAAAVEEEAMPPPQEADDWLLGPGTRDRGSIHSDIWRGSAAELADRDAICVYPVSGWWKEKPKLQRWERSSRYALIVSIRAPETEVDLYAAIESKLQVEIPAG